jgi:uncharacterized protein (TIGR03435 family)
MNAWIDLAGWTLIHFVWQGAVVAAIAGGLMWLLRHRSPQARYAVACAGLVAMLVLPIMTASALSRSVAVAGTGTPASVPRQVGPGADTVPDALAILANLTMARGVSSVDLVPNGSSAWLPLVVVMWVAGVVVLFVRLVGGWWRIHRLHRASRAAASSGWTAASARIATSLGLARRIHVVDSSLVDTPTVIGWVTPIILLPVAAFAGLSSSQIEAILAHELAHIRRHDFLVNLLQTCAETVLFYHPAVWWLSARIRAEREHCCDEVALSVCGDAISYAEALVELESWRRVHTPLVMAATGGKLMTRVRRLLRAPAVERSRSVGVMIGAGVVALVCVAGASAYVLAAQPDRNAQPPQGSADDPAPWSMVFNQADSTMRFIGYRGRDLIRFAYQIPEARVVGGPSWLDEQILNIVVELAMPPRADEMPGIVQQALQERLQLKTHIEQRNFPVLALIRGNNTGALGPNLRVASRPCFDVQQWIAAGQPPDRVPSQANRIPACGGELDSPLGWTRYASITMPQFAEELRGYVKGWPMTPPEPQPARRGPTLVAVKAPDIVDRTGLRGRYDLEFSAFYPTAALMSRFPLLRNVFEPLGFASIPRALQDQLGLMLVESEAPYDVIVIDNAERP